MRIGLVGTEYAISVIKSLVTAKNSFVEVIEYCCNVEEAGALVERTQSQLDGILFTGYFPFSYACHSATATIPWTYAKRTANAALNALLKSIIRGIDVSRITYDLTENATEQISGILCNDIGLSKDSLHLYRYVDANYYTISEKEYVRNAKEFHLDNLRSGRASVCLSGMHEVVEGLQQQNYPAFWVRPTEEVLDLSLNELSLRHQIRKNQKNAEQYQVAEIALSVHFQDLGPRGGQEYLRLHSNHQVESCIYNFAQSICASVEQDTYGRFLLYTIKSELAAVTNRFSHLSLLQELQLIPHIADVEAGIGFSFSPNVAKANAVYGVEIAEKRNCSCYYVVADRETVAGPFSSGSAGGEMQTQAMWKQMVSSETGIGIITLETIAKVQAQYGFETITPGKLAEMCEMTQSNMNRILAKLETKGYVQTVGYQPLDGAGRPRRLIRLKINMER